MVPAFRGATGRTAVLPLPRWPERDDDAGMSTSEPGPVRWRRVVVAVVATVTGLVILAVAAAIALSWRADLPDPVASHWDASGQPNGFSTLDATVRFMAVAGTVLVLLFGAIAGWLGRSSVGRRVGAAGAVWSALFFATLTLGPLAVQRGLTRAEEAGEANSALVLAMVGPLIVAVVVGALVPGLGIVLRRGEAPLIERTGGRSVAVTVPGAASAAGVINTAADRIRRL